MVVKLQGSSRISIERRLVEGEGEKRVHHNNHEQQTAPSGIIGRVGTAVGGAGTKLPLSCHTTWVEREAVGGQVVGRQVRVFMERVGAGGSALPSLFPSSSSHPPPPTGRKTERHTQLAGGMSVCHPTRL